jgi:hypothetical protein
LNRLSKRFLNLYWLVMFFILFTHNQ